MHPRKPHAPERRVSACYAKLFTAPSRTQPPASITPTCNPRAQPPVDTAPNPRTQTHSPTNAATDHRLPSGLANFEDLRIEVLGDLLHKKHEVQTTASTTLSTEFQEFQGLLPGCYNIHDHLTDLLRDLLLQQAFLRHHPVNLHHLRCTRKSSACSTFQCLTALPSVGATPLLTFDIVLVRSTLFLAASSQSAHHCRCSLLPLYLCLTSFLTAFSQLAPLPRPVAGSLSPLGHGVRGVRILLCCLCLQLFLQLCLAFSSLLGGRKEEGEEGGGKEDGLGVLTVGARPEPGRSQAGARPERRRETPRSISRGYGRRS